MTDAQRLTWLILICTLGVIAIVILMALAIIGEVKRHISKLDIARRPVSERPLGSYDRVKYDLGRNYETANARRTWQQDHPVEAVEALQQILGADWEITLRLADVVGDSIESSPLGDHESDAPPWGEGRDI